MKFTKMQGLGNDYLYVYAESMPENAADLSVRLSDRHFGAGSDGMIWILPSERADFTMRIFNADGSEAKMCGNGIRCVGKYVYDKGYTSKTCITVETLSGIKTVILKAEDGRVQEATVEMGRVKVGEERELPVGETMLRCIPVDMGNPHAVIFTEDAEKAPLTTLGPQIEHHPAFPGGVNVEFVQCIDERTLRMRVWERGSGVTMACGTGACASTAAAVRAGLCPVDTEIRVLLDGGVLRIQIGPEGEVRMSGPAETVYEGEVKEIVC